MKKLILIVLVGLFSITGFGQTWTDFENKEALSSVRSKINAGMSWMYTHIGVVGTTEGQLLYWDAAVGVWKAVPVAQMYYDDTGKKIVLREVEVSTSLEVTKTIGQNVTPDVDMGMVIAHAPTVTATENGLGAYINPTFTEAATGTHTTMAGVYINGFTVNDDVGATTDNIASLYIAGAPTGATATNSNYAIQVAAGNSYFGGEIESNANITGENLTLKSLADDATADSVLTIEDGVIKKTAFSIVIDTSKVLFLYDTTRWAASAKIGTKYDVDSLTSSVYDSLAVHSDTLQAHNTRIITNYDNTINNSLSQGVTWDSDADTYTRLGSLVNIATSISAGDDYLPIQSDMKRCLLQDAGTVNYYINATNPIMKDGETVTITSTTDGTTANKLEDSGADFVTDGIAAGQFVYNVTDDTYSIITAVDDLNTLSLERDVFVSGEVYEVGTANFGGADGQVMQEIPKFYYKHTLVGTLNSWCISKYDLPGFELHPAFWKDGQEVDYRYYSAFEGSMWDATTSAMVAKADIVTNMYASGDKMCSVAGTWAKVNETRAEYRTMSAERGTGFRQLDYALYSAVQLLYLVEYADFNSHTMIGGGRTNLTGGTWTADSYIGLTGLSIGDGNGTNSVMSGILYDVDGTGYLTDYMCYRGIENLFGNVWKMIDGITWDGRWTGSAAAQPVYITNNSDYFADETGTNMKHLCDASYIGASAGYISNIEEVTGFIPSLITSGSSTTYLTDYYYQYSEVGRDYWRVVLVGGNANYGGKAGVFALSANAAWSNGSTSYAARLAY